MGVRWILLVVHEHAACARVHRSAPTGKTVGAAPPTLARGVGSAARMRASSSPARKGLRHVVVGAGVERGDLVALLASGRQDDDGDGRPLAHPGQYSRARRCPGSPRSRMTRSGSAGGQLQRPSSPGGGPEESVVVPASAARRKRRIWGSSSISTTDGPAMAPGLARSARHPRSQPSPVPGRRRASESGSVKKKAAPPSGRLCAQMRPPCARTIPRQIASPRPAAPTVRGRPVELLEDARPPAPFGKPRAVIRDLGGNTLVGRGHDNPDRVVRRACT